MLYPRASSVSDVFTFNDSPMALAPSEPISFPVKSVKNFTLAILLALFQGQG